MDITGGNNEKVKTKKNNLIEWIRSEQENIKDYELRGVVLAPSVNKTSEVIGPVAVVCGNDARKLLGGLKHISRYLL